MTGAFDMVYQIQVPSSFRTPFSPVTNQELNELQFQKISQLFALPCMYE